MSALVLALALGAAAPAPAPQNFTETQKDARCVVALTKMTETPEVSANAEGKAAVTGVMLFFMGRLSTRVAPGQMAQTTNEAEASLPASEYKAHALECINRMRTLAGIS
jgi:hypothetical protein